MTSPSELKAQNRQFFVISLIVFLSFLGISMPYLIFPALFLNAEYSIVSSWPDNYQVILLGITLAAYPLGQFIGSPILGALSDEYGRKRLLAITLLLSAICNLITAIAIDYHALITLIVSRFVVGIMEGNIAIARAMAADLKGIPKQKTLGNINAMASIAFLVGPLIGGMLTDKNLMASLSPSSPFYVITIFFIFLAALSLLILKESVTIYTGAQRTLLQRINLFQRMGKLFADKHLRFLLIASTTFTVAVDIFYEFGPVYLTMMWKLEPSHLIPYNALLCFALAIGNGFLPRLFNDENTKRPAILWSMGTFAGFLIGMVCTDMPALIILFFSLSGFLIGVSGTLMTVMISDAASDTIQGEVMGVQMSLRVLCDALICLFGGFLLLVSSKLILIVAAIISLLAMTYFAGKRTGVLLDSP